MNVRWLFRPSITFDGNFKAEQIKMRKLNDDVGLINGEGYMVEDARYRKHLSVAVESSEVMSSMLFGL